MMLTVMLTVQVIVYKVLQTGVVKLMQPMMSVVFVMVVMLIKIVLENVLVWLLKMIVVSALVVHLIM